MEQLFKEGDFIKRIKSYKGEHENLIVKVDTVKQEYEMAWMKGKHSPKADFKNTELIDFENAHASFKKVG